VQREDGRFVDVFRPFVEEDGYDSPAQVINARQQHLKNVRDMLRESDIFVFTLGLTEAWISKETKRTLFYFFTTIATNKLNAFIRLRSGCYPINYAACKQYPTSAQT